MLRLNESRDSTSPGRTQSKKLTLNVRHQAQQSLSVNLTLWVRKEASRTLKGSVSSANDCAYGRIRATAPPVSYSEFNLVNPRPS